MTASRRIESLRAGAVAVLLAVLPLPSAGQQTAGRPPPDVKGWRGAEWGMTPAQVAAAIGLPLGDLVPPASPTAKPYHRVEKVAAGDWTVEARFSFGTKGLTTITLEFGPTTGFQPVRDELTARYGPPVSESTDSLAGGTITLSRAKWLLPSTEINCVRSDSRGSPPLVARVLCAAARGFIPDVDV